MGIIINLIVNGFAVFVTGYLLSGVKIDSFVTALIVSVVLGIVNTIIKPILTILTLPLTVITLGLFSFIINGLMILLVSYFVKGFVVVNIWWAILFSIVLSIVSWFLNLLTK